jgi:hypothetical protein
MKKHSSTLKLTEENLLRSINIVFDADHPERITHYFPTTKSISLLNNLLTHKKSNSYFVVAPYGSGKSLLGTFYLQLIENISSVNSVLKPVINRIRHIDNKTHRLIKTRMKSSIKGIAVPLSGYIENVPQSIYDGILKSLERTQLTSLKEVLEKHAVQKFDDLIELLSLVRNQFGNEVVDHIDIVWDEFGRHLEEIIIRGDAQRINELQLLSEFSSRSQKISMTIVLFLHQGLMRYASNIPRAISDEWKKVEARFETIQYIDDSKEITLLASRVLSSRFPNRLPNEQKQEVIHSDMKNTGLFHDLSDEDLESVIKASYPILPAALYVLPRISSRVAQNERTLFSFLFALTGDSVVSPSEVFDYFSDLMRSDTTLGGTYHHWLETQNALSKSDNQEEERIIKTLSLLSLGFSGERNRVSRQALLTLSKDYVHDEKIEKSLDTLIQRKHILYRKNSNSVVLWHANDIDVRGRIEAEKVQIHHTFDLISYINDYLPLDSWRPLEYNIEKNMTRFYRGECVSLQTIKEYGEKTHIISDLQSDGVIWYFIPETEDEIGEAKDLILQNFNDPRIVALIPRSTEGLFNVSIEAAAIERLLEDTSLLSEDPLVEPELKLMLDDTLTYLMKIIEKLFFPSVKGPYIICDGEEQSSIASKKALRKFLSGKMYEKYPKTPRFNNELINKRSPSKVIVNARKKLLIGILDRYGQPDLGIDGNRPDKSMLETLLVQTGLYIKHREGHWGFARTDQIKDEQYKELWDILENFFASPAKEPKDFTELYKKLSSPPLGIREGLFPIFTAVGFRAFPAAVTLTSPNGEYIDDIKPSVIEEIFKKPDQYAITVVELSNDEKKYLTALKNTFNPSEETMGHETDPIRRCFDALEGWKSTLPPAAFYSRKFSRQVLLFQKLIFRTKNPALLFLDEFFFRFGVEKSEWRKLIEAIQTWKFELENIVNHYYDSASRTIASTLQIGNEKSIRDAGLQWIKILPKDIQQILKDDSSRAIIERFAFPYEDEKTLIDSLSSLLIGKRIEKWDDSTITLFDREFKNIVHRIEDEALDSPINGDNDEKIAIDLLNARIDNLFKRLETIVGTEEALSHLKKISKRME